MLSDKELIELINLGESDRVEFTSSVKDLDKCREAICAFANDLPVHEKPGVLFIGLDDNGNCANLPIDDRLLQTLGGLRSDGNILPFPVMQVSKKTLRDCKVAVVQVEPSDNTPLRVNGRCWIRVGPRRDQATFEEERRLAEKRRWKDVEYDSQGVFEATIEADFDMRRFKEEYLPSAAPLKILEENRRPPEQQLEALGLVRPGGIPTVAAILLFNATPRRWFPGAYIQFVRFDGKKVTDPVVDQVEVNGSLFDQLRQIDVILKQNITRALDTSGETHVEIPDYPFEALRELVRNAVIHRNYDSNTPVRLYWFSDRVEVVNPGPLYGEVNRANFGAGHMTAYRNPTIAEAMKNMEFIQKFGYGIPTARETLEENGNPPFEFDVQDPFILVIIRKRT